MPLEHALQALRSDSELRRSPDGRSGFVEWRELPAQDARYGDFPAATSQRLIDALAHRGIDRPYTHQARRTSRRHAAQNVVVVTPTACGKTLCYNVPVLQTILDDPRRARSTSSRRRRSPRTSSTSCTASSTDLGRGHRHLHLRRRHARRRAPRGARRRGTSSSPTPTCSTPASCPTTRSGCSSSRACATSSSTSCTPTAACSAATSRTSAAAAAHLPLLRLRPDLHLLLGHDRQPGGARRGTLVGDARRR